MAIIYICGPDPRTHPEDFNRIEQKAKEMGYVVLNPATLPPDLYECSYLPIYLAMLEAADLMYVLPGCDNDECRTQLYYANKQNITQLHSIQDLNNERVLWGDDYSQEDLFPIIDCEIWKGKENG